MNDDIAHDSSRRPCSFGLPSTNINVVDLLEKIQQQTDVLESENQQRLNLERQLRELAIILKTSRLFSGVTRHEAAEAVASGK